MKIVFKSSFLLLAGIFLIGGSQSCIGADSKRVVPVDRSRHERDNEDLRKDVLQKQYNQKCMQQKALEIQNKKTEFENAIENNDVQSIASKIFEGVFNYYVTEEICSLRDIVVKNRNPIVTVMFDRAIQTRKKENTEWVDLMRSSQVPNVTQELEELRASTMSKSIISKLFGNN